MGIQGDFSTVGLPDVLQLLSAGSKTGTLVVTLGSGASHLYFREGKIIYAASSDQKESLLNILVRIQGITPEQAEEIRVKSKKTKKSIEYILKYGKYVSKEQLIQASMILAKEIVYDLFRRLEGKFEFREGELPPGDAMSLTVSLGAFSLIMEGTRQIDEWSRIRKVIPSMETVFKPDRDPENLDMDLAEDELKVFSLVDGVRSVRMICAAARKSEFDVCRILYALKSADIISVNPNAVPAISSGQRKKTISGRWSAGVIIASLVLAVFAGVILKRTGKTPPITMPVGEHPADQETPEDFSGSIPETAQQQRENTMLPDRNFSYGNPENPDTTRLDTSRTGTAETGAVQSAMRIPVSPGPVNGSDAQFSGSARSFAGNSRDSPNAPEPNTSGTGKRYSTSGSRRTVPLGKVDINSASAEELTALPRIGPATAKKIIAYRTENGPFLNPHDIVNVPRIGEKTFAKLAPYIIAGDVPGVSGGNARAAQTGTKVSESGHHPASVGRGRSETGANTGPKININSASIAELVKLPGIGPKKAQRIIMFRENNGPYAETHDIVKVKGIGEKSYERLKNLITVR